ncbi:hypothetical protein HDV00_011912 [Rhizophlyctis rosea]|nr:hypothetical protein HDV00_011912 [Rhizophlyctis rosea]
MSVVAPPRTISMTPPPFIPPAPSSPPPAELPTLPPQAAPAAIPRPVPPPRSNSQTSLNNLTMNHTPLLLHLARMSSNKLTKELLLPDECGKDSTSFRRVVLLQNMMATLREGWDRRSSWSGLAGGQDRTKGEKEVGRVEKSGGKPGRVVMKIGGDDSDSDSDSDDEVQIEVLHVGPPPPLPPRKQTVEEIWGRSLPSPPPTPDPKLESLFNSWNLEPVESTPPPPPYQEHPYTPAPAVNTWLQWAENDTTDPGPATPLPPTPPPRKHYLQPTLPPLHETPPPEDQTPDLDTTDADTSSSSSIETTDEPESWSPKSSSLLTFTLPSRSPSYQKPLPEPPKVDAEPVKGVGLSVKELESIFDIGWSINL